MKKTLILKYLLIGILLIILFSGCELGEPVKAPAYTVVYNGGDGGIGSMANSTHVYGAYKDLNANQFTHPVLDFAGWAESPDGDVRYSDKQRVKNLTETDGAMVTLYAQWGYTLSYDGNGATSGNPPASQTVKPGNTVVVKGPETMRKEGETFVRWDTLPGGTGNAYTAGDPVTLSGGNITLFAYWAEMTPVEVADEAGSSLISAQLNWVAANAVSDTLYILTAGAGEGLSSRTLSYAGKSNIIIRLKGAGSEQTLTLGGTGPMFTVGSGVTLSLYENITLKGRGTANTGDSLVKVNSGGTLVMKAGSEITENTNSKAGGSNYGGGVYVAGGANFTMEGGTISGNNVSVSSARGGGVYVDSDATFTMSGGEISGNTSDAASSYGGGVYVGSGTTFTMSGGTISGNFAIGSTGSSNGGGVCISGGFFIMRDGTISGNTAGSGGGSGYGRGGGVSVIGSIGMGGSFTMEGGTITGNIAQGIGFIYFGDTPFPEFSYGGGVYLSITVFNKIGGTITGYTSGNNISYNVVKDEYNNPIDNTNGHAVYAAPLRGSIRRQESTADTGVLLSFNGTIGSVSSGGWEY